MVVFFFRLLYGLTILTFALFSNTIFSQESLANPDFIKFPPLKKDRTNSILWSLQKPDEQLEIHLFEGFESQLPWIQPSRSAHTHISRFLYLNPLTDKKTGEGLKKIYQSDLKRLKNSTEIHFRTPIKKQNYSYELRCFFHRPGKENVYIRPGPNTLNKFKINGLPRVFAVWVKSSLHRRHKLYALFSDYRKKIISVYMGDLAFDGWFRLEQVIPTHLVRRNPYNQNKYELTLEGLKIQSDYREEPGLYIIVFDLLMLSIDHNTASYPGSQMQDDRQ